MKIFPYALFRIAGVPLNTLSALRLSDKFIANLNHLNITQQKYINLQFFLNNQLTNYLNTSHNYKLKTRLKNVRNDIYKGKFIKIHKIKSWIEILTNKEQLIIDKIQTYNQLKIEISEQKETLKTLYHSELQTIRQQFQLLTHAPNLKKGLVQASLSLLRQLKKYQAKPVEQFKKKELQTEKSIIRYFSRMATKSSPFSTLTSLAIIPISNQSMSLEIVDDTPISYIRLNNFLLRYFTTLLLQIPNFVQTLFVRLNPTIQLEIEEFIFLLNTHNIESIQRIERNGVLDLLYEFFSEHGKWLNDLTLIQQLQEYIEAETDELDNYLRQLIQYGFLEVVFPISGTDSNWLDNLIKLLDNTPQNTVIQEVKALLLKVHQHTLVYAESKIATRISLLTTIYQLLEATGKKLENAINPNEPNDYFDGFQRLYDISFEFKKEQILYEDTRLNVKGIIEHKAIKALLQPLSTLLKSIAFMRQKEKVKAADFFKIHYNTDEIIPLLTFYEAFYKQKNFKSPTLETLNLTLKNWLTELAKQWKKQLDQTIINISIQDIESINSKINPTPNDIKGTSIGAFIQLYQEENNALKGVVNATFMGYGKFFGRFLHLFPNDLTQTIYQRNEALLKGTIFCDNTDASYFNANIHPPILPYEIVVPDGHNQLKDSQRIPILDIGVACKNGDIYLKHLPTQKIIYVFDLGFQTLKGRSPLYQLLSLFTPSCSPSLHLIKSLLEKINPPNPTKVVFLPRLVLAQKLILQRRTWIVPTVIFPQKQTGQSHNAYFITVNQWRKSHQIPEQVFFTIQTRKVNNLVRTDDYKPQFIDFYNPILVQLLASLIPKADNSIHIIEMFPKNGNLLKTNNTVRVSETLLEWEL